MLCITSSNVMQYVISRYVLCFLTKYCLCITYFGNATMLFTKSLVIAWWNVACKTFTVSITTSTNVWSACSHLSLSINSINYMTNHCLIKLHESFITVLHKTFTRLVSFHRTGLRDIFDNTYFYSLHENGMKHVRVINHKSAQNSSVFLG